jgi:hypothetical protein
MGFFSSLFGKPVDKVGSHVRQNSNAVSAYMKNVHSNVCTFGDFNFEYLYTSSELISQNGEYGSVIYIRIESPKHEFVAALPADNKEIQKSIDKHQSKFSSLPDDLSKDKTRWMYFNMGTIFRVS